RRARGRGERRDAVAARRMPEIRAPRVDRVLPAPEIGFRMIVARGKRGAIVERRIDQELVRDTRTAALPCEERERGGEVAARARAADRDARGIDAERAALVGEPCERGIAIVERCRETVLGRETIIDRYDDAADLLRERREREIVHLEVAEHPAARVHPQERG